MGQQLGNGTVCRRGVKNVTLTVFPPTLTQTNIFKNNVDYYKYRMVSLLWKFVDCFCSNFDIKVLVRGQTATHPLPPPDPDSSHPGYRGAQTLGLTAYSQNNGASPELSARGNTFLRGETAPKQKKYHKRAVSRQQKSPELCLNEPFLWPVHSLLKPSCSTNDRSFLKRL